MKKVSVLFLFVLILGCAKEDVVPIPEGITYGLIVNKAEGEIRSEVVSNLDMNKYLIRVTDSTVVYSEQTPNNEILQVGKIVIGNPDRHSKYGFLRTILTREEIGNEIVLTTKQASIGDAFKNLNIDIQYNHDGSSLFRGPGEIDLTEYNPIIIPLGTAGNGAAITKPFFGFTGGPVCRVTSDPVSGDIDEIIFGIENLTYQLQLDTRLELVASSDNFSKEFILPVEFPLGVPIGPYVVTILTRIKFNPTVEPKARGIIDFTQNIKPGPFNMLAKIRPFESNLTDAFKTEISSNIPPNIEDLNYDFTIKDIVGELSCEYSMPISIEFAPYGFFDAVSTGLELNLISYDFSAKTETDNGKLQARVSSKINSGAKFFISSDFVDEIVNGADLKDVIDFVPPYELNIYDKSFPHDDDIYCFPCEKDYTNIRVDNNCIGDEVEFKFRVNATSPGNAGYKVTLGKEEIGVYDYNVLHTFSKPSKEVQNVLEFIIKDEESFGCLVKRTVINKCVANVVCQSNEFEDKRDGEKYCYVISNNVKMMSRNLNYSGTGVCYDNQLDNCLILGRLYTFDEAQTACPDGWRLPSIKEYQDALKGLSQSQFLSPLIIGNSQNTNGLNFLPGGEYHSWASNTKKFAASLFDPGTKKYLYWTSDEQVNEVGGLENGGVAFNVTGKIPVSSPRNAGYPCRCIKK